MWPFRKRVPEPVKDLVYSEAGTKLYESLVRGEGWAYKPRSLDVLTNGVVDVTEIYKYVAVWCDPGWSSRERFTEGDHTRILPVLAVLVERLKGNSKLVRAVREEEFVRSLVEKL